MGKKIRTRIGAAVALLLVLPGMAAAQCAMCRELAAQAGADKAINLAILVLLIPTLVLFVGVLVFALRRRDRETEVPVTNVSSRTHTETVLRVSWLHEPHRSVKE